MNKLLLVIAIATMFASCDNSNEDVVKQPSKDGAIEAQMTTKHCNGFDILSTEYKVWVKNSLQKDFIVIDTLPSLGTTKEEGEDSDGNTKDIVVPKDYEIYITVK